MFVMLKSSILFIAVSFLCSKNNKVIVCITPCRVSQKPAISVVVIVDIEVHNLF